MENTVTNVQSDIRTNIDSDHIALHVNIIHKLKKLEATVTDNSLRCIRFICKDGDISDLVRVRYLETAKIYLREASNMDEASNALWKAAEETLDTRRREWEKETHPDIKNNS